jgi:hypothetical protein
MNTLDDIPDGKAVSQNLIESLLVQLKEADEARARLISQVERSAAERDEQLRAALRLCFAWVSAWEEGWEDTTDTIAQRTGLDINLIRRLLAKPEDQS